MPDNFELPEIKLKGFLYLAILLAAANFLLWTKMPGKSSLAPGFYFLDVGQGDSELAVMRNGVKILTDAGPDKKAANSLSDALGPLETYVDIAVITHPQLDHYGGFAELLRHYDFGAVIINGREPQTPIREWSDLMKEFAKKGIPIIALGAGDSIRAGDDGVQIISPDAKMFADKELNNTAIVQKVEIGGTSELLTSDMGEKAEKYILNSGTDVKADILKVAHHGSKYSSTPAFLRAVSPVVAAIEVGKKNKYGHPTEAVLARLADIGASVFRTDILGTFNVRIENEKLVVSE